MMTITSCRNPSRYAVLTDDEAGVRVEVWERCRGDVARLVESGVLEAPFHHALDLVHEELG